jgi:hypothetical protein
VVVRLQLGVSLGQIFQNLARAGLRPSNHHGLSVSISFLYWNIKQRAGMKFAMESISSTASRLVRASNASKAIKSWPNSRISLFAAPAAFPVLQRHSKRTFTSSPLVRAPPHSLLGISSSSQSPPTSYFQRPSLPANTVIRFVPQQTAWIVERMGKFNRILQPGLAILIPFLDRIAYVRSLKEAAIEIPSQSAITADNVTLELDGVLYTRVFDAYKAR